MIGSVEKLNGRQSCLAKIGTGGNILRTRASFLHLMAAPRSHQRNDDIPLRAYPPAGSGLQKQQARVKPITARHQSQPTDRYRPPSPPVSTRVVVAKKRKSVDPGPGPGKAADPPVVEAYAIPISEYTSRVLPGKLDINKQFSKGYMASTPIKQPPLPNMTLSSLWHAVSEYT